MAETKAPAGTQTLIHGIVVLRAVAHGARNLKEVTGQTGLSRSSAHRLIQALRSQRFLREESNGDLRLGPALIELGFQARDEISIQEVARPFLLDLAQTAKDTVHLAVEDSGSALYLDKIHGSRGIEIRSWPGCRMPLTFTGIGKALLLDDPDRWQSQYIQDRNLQDRKPEHDYANEKTFAAAMRQFANQGFAYDLEENEPGIRCVAAPVRDGAGAVTAAISISAAATFMPGKRMKELGRLVRRTAACISVQLGYGGDEDIAVET